jgi:uncharacterized Zn-binding protein involved in type VI secretion
MKPVARGNSADAVLSATGSGFQCKSPTQTSTNACSPNVRVNGIGAVRIGDVVSVHNMSFCVLESPPLSTGSSTVRVNGKGVGRLGDNYAGDGSNIILSGSQNVRAGG